MKAEREGRVCHMRCLFVWVFACSGRGLCCHLVGRGSARVSVGPIPVHSVASVFWVGCLAGCCVASGSLAALAPSSGNTLNGSKRGVCPLPRDTSPSPVQQPHSIHRLLPQHLLAPRSMCLVSPSLPTAPSPSRPLFPHTSGSAPHQTSFPLLSAASAFSPPLVVHQA